MCRRLTIPVLASVVLLGLVQKGWAGDEVEVEKLYHQVVKSCVFIVTPMKDGRASGGGSLIDAEQRLVLTVGQVVGDEPKAFVQFPIFGKDGRVEGDKEKYLARVQDGTAIAAKVLHKDPTRNLVLLQLEKVPEGMPALRVAEKNTVPGATVWHMGMPGSPPRLFTLTQGKVREVKVGEFPFNDGKKNAIARRQILIATYPTFGGESGSPVFDRDGRLVAVTDEPPRHFQVVTVPTAVEEVRAFLAEKKVTIKGDGTKEVPKK